MASITCRNGSAMHTHTSVLESKYCWGILTRPSSGGFVARPTSPPVDPATPKQIEYVGTLDGDKDKARAMTKSECSDYIKTLLQVKKREVKAPVSALAKQERTKREEFILGLLPSIPDGYFAVTADGSDSNVTFLRKKCPTSGKLKGCTKIQTQHSDDLTDRMIYYPGSDHLWQDYRNKDSVQEAVMLLFADWRGAAMRYARLIGKCCRCNKALTDSRSRFYGIGPECEQYWPEMIEEVEAIKGPYREGY